MAIVKSAGVWRMRQARKHPKEWLVASAVPGWDGWHVQLQVGRLLDGTPVLKGLLLEPNDMFDGQSAEQVLTTQRLRRLPLGLLLAAGAQCLAEEAGDVETQNRLDEALFDASKRHAVGLVEAASRERLGDALYLHERIVGLQRAYVQRQGPHGVRQHIAEQLGIHERTVDRHLARARKLGELEPYRGKRGKFGKTTEHAVEE